MAAVKIAMIDKRVNSRADVLRLKEPVDHTLIVDASKPLKTALTEAATWAGNRKIEVLKIVAHGVTTTDPKSRLQAYSIAFCKEEITARTAAAFAVLKAKFQSTTLPGIELIACGSTESGGTASKTLISQGIALCQAVANAAGAVVKASPEVQTVGERTMRASTDPRVMKIKVVINPGPWEGRVWYFRPNQRGPYVRKAGSYKRAQVR